MGARALERVGADLRLGEDERVVLPPPLGQFGIDAAELLLIHRLYAPLGRGEILEALGCDLTDREHLFVGGALIVAADDDVVE